MLRLYDNKESRNGYKVVLLLTQLGRPFERVELDIFEGASRTPEFLARNPAGKIPALELEDGTVLAESGAILWYLAEGTNLLPEDPVGRAQVLRWMFFEQNAHETSVAEARFILRHPELSQGRQGDILAEKQKRGNAALALMDQHLAANDFFAAGRYTIADIALYGYTQVAGEGGFDLARYPAVGAWLARVAALPGHVPATTAYTKGP
jgi:glutathione S-transferase